VCLSANGRHVLSGNWDGTLGVWMLDWELDDKEPADWNDGARLYLEIFLSSRSPYAATLPPDRDLTEEDLTLALTRRGQPMWTEEDF
jgi:hypothetical protein